MSELLKIINNLRVNSFIKNNETYIEELEYIQNRYEDKNFKIAVVGEFSSGKSTFINALIGKDLLKHATLETTATVTYIHNVNQDTKIKVTYTDGRVIEYKDYSFIQDTTTTLSNEDVVNNIDYVDIYVKFSDVNNDFTIVDTPGLNGTADKHREKTIEEIKKSHACIYILQKNGITDSDREFLRFLFNYQNNFIFVQNFIDELKESEGETIEKKINSVKNDIENIIKLQNNQIGYNIVGISALKAVAGKDKNVNKLYENDLVELTDEIREKHLNDSNIDKVEKLINSLNKNTNNEKSRYNLAIYSLEEFLRNVIDKESIIVERNNEFLKNDDLYKNKELIDEEIEQLEANKNKIIEKLNNLVSSEFIRYRRLIDEDIKEQLNDINFNIKNEIEKENSYEKFESKCNNQYFLNELQHKIDNYKDELEKSEYYIIQNIYKSMLKRLEIYTKYSSKKINFEEIDLTQVEKRSFTFKDKQDEIDRMNKQLLDNKVEVKSNEDEMKTNEDEIKKIDDKRKNKEKSLTSIEQQRKISEQNLGLRPEKELDGYDIKYEEVERRGIFKGIRKALFGAKTREKKVPRYSDRRGIEWDRKKRQIEAQYQQDREFVNRELNELIRKRNDYQSKLEENKFKIENGNKKLKYLEEEIKARKEELEIYENYAKKEYLRERKSQLIKDINDYLFISDNNNLCIKDVLEDKVKQDFGCNKPKLEKEIRVECSKHIDNERVKLESLRDGNIEELNKRYYDNQKYLDDLKQIYKQVGEKYYE